MEGTRVQILYSFSIIGRKGRVGVIQLLSGALEGDAEAMEMVSEFIGDRRRVSLLGGFIDPPSPNRHAVGADALWFTPLDGMRELYDMEVFHTLPK
jgi:hypothetical protein